MRGISNSGGKTSFSKWRLPVIGVAVLGVVSFEFIEHQVFIGGKPFDADFLRDIVFYGVVASLAGGYIFHRLERLYLSYQQSSVNYDHLRKLIEQLNEAQDLQEASTIYIQSLRATLPITGAQILLYDPGVKIFRRAAIWPHNTSFPLPVPLSSGKSCSLNLSDSPEGSIKLAHCFCLSENQGQTSPHPYCYPLIANNQVMAVLYLYNMEELDLSSEQENLLRDMTTEVVAALKRIHLQVFLDRHKTSHANIQQKLAKDIHATLGHNLAFLRLKLDQISSDCRIEDGPIQEDLVQLRDTANETYQQMRDLLVALTPESTPDLRSTLSKYAQRVADRAGFNLEVLYSGEPRSLEPMVLQHVILLIREALGNIEKHAQADHVHIRVDWNDDGLRIRIADNGHGFDTTQPLCDENLGIRFMRERASDVNGEFALTSSINSGTQISLWVPFKEG